MAEVLGCVEPRLWTQPLRDLDGPAGDLGRKCYAFARDVLRVEPDPWQQWCMLHMLETLEDGSFRFRTVLLLVARQNGKSKLVQMILLWLLFTGRIHLAVGTAQSLSVSKRQWEEAVDWSMRTPELRALMKGEPRRQNGGEALRSQAGGEYTIAASTADAARGIPGCDFLVMDELRTHHDFAAYGALTKTQMARPNALCLLMSNAGDDLSVVLNSIREVALGGGDRALGVFEYSAPDGCELDDIEGIRQANPSLGNGRLTLAAVEASRALDPPAVHRCLDVATPVLTNRGTLSMAEIGIGDAVKSPSGAWIDVVGVSPTHVDRDCYRVTLNDGRSIVCDADHLWTVRDRRRPRAGFAATRTADLLSRGVTYHNPSMNFDVRNFALPPVAPLDGPDVELPVHPYLLGLWLGDGSRRTATVFVEDRDAGHVEVRMVEAGAVITTRADDSAHCVRLGFQVGGRGDFTRALRSLGVYPQMPYRQAVAADFRKFIPDAYLTGSLRQRLDLLRGLMDSDGTVTARTGRCCFVNTDATLIAGVRTLVRSLGWKTSDLAAGQYGESHHLPRLSVDFTPRPGDPCPVTLPRKVERIRAARGTRDVRPVTIASIEPVDSVPVRCIQVAAPDGLFLAGDGLVPTHNTEVLCQRVETLDSAVDLGGWKAGLDPGDLSGYRGKIAACVDVSLDGSHVSLYAAADVGEGRVRVEPIAAWRGTEAARDELDAILDALKPYALAWYPGGPANALAPILKAHKGSVEITGNNANAACMGFADLVKAGRVIHGPDALLDTQLARASKLNSGDGWRFGRRAGDAGSNVDSCYAVAGAIHACLTLPPPAPPRKLVLL